MLQKAVLYGAVGGLQLVVDWVTFFLLTIAGVPVAAANLTARVAGAVLGFVLNGRWTFGGASRRVLHRRSALRFAMVWLLTTAASTVGVSWADANFGREWAWAAKPALDAALALAGFLASRHWVYRDDVPKGPD